MIRINWTEVEATKNKLLREGATSSLEMVVMILYHSHSEVNKIEITLDQLEESLFDICNDKDVKSIFLYDAQIKKPYLKCEAHTRVSALERVPNSGHPNIIAELQGMSPEARDVWHQIAIASAQYYISQGV